MIIDAPVIEASPDQEYPQVVKLKTGLYGGLFARYSEVKDRPKYDGDGMEAKFFVSFVVTHDAAARQLPYFSEAFTGIRPKIYYDATSGKMSTYVAFLAAIGGKDWTPATVVEAAKKGTLPDLDTLIGRPALLFISPSLKADKNGNFSNKIDANRGGFEKVDAALARAIHPIFKAAEFGYTKDGKMQYLAKPVAAYQKDVVENDAHSGDNFDEEIPF